MCVLMLALALGARWALGPLSVGWAFSTSKTSNAPKHKHKHTKGQHKHIYRDTSPTAHLVCSELGAPFEICGTGMCVFVCARTRTARRHAGRRYLTEHYHYECTSTEYEYEASRE